MVGAQSLADRLDGLRREFLDKTAAADPPKLRQQRDALIVAENSIQKELSLRPSASMRELDRREPQSRLTTAHHMWPPRRRGEARVFNSPFEEPAHDTWASAVIPIEQEAAAQDVIPGIPRPVFNVSFRSDPPAIAFSSTAAVVQALLRLRGDILRTAQIDRTKALYPIFVPTKVRLLLLPLPGRLPDCLPGPSLAT